MKPVYVKLRIHLAVEFHHLLRRGIAEKILVVRDVKELGLNLHILVYLFSVNGHRALIRLQNSAQHP